MPFVYRGLVITKISVSHKEQLEYLIARIDILKDITERLCKEKIVEYDTMDGIIVPCEISRCRIYNLELRGSTLYEMKSSKYN